MLRGQKLWLVPGKVTAPAAPSTKPSKSSTATKNYKVKPGDGLIALSRQFNVPTTTLANLNNMGTTDSLYVGQILKVPANVDFTAANTSSSSASNPVKTSAPTSTVATTNYKVKSGDTLIGIANSVGISPEELAAVNPNFDARTRLQRGQTIKVPVSKDLVDR